MLSFEEFCEELNIKHLKWKDSLTRGDITVKFEVFDTKEHDILERISERTNTPKKILRDKIYKAIDSLILKKLEKNWFTQNKVNIGIHFEKSKFTASFLLNVEERYLRLNTILDEDMVYSRGIKWDINESVSEL